jgi:hypothetical protein
MAGIGMPILSSQHREDNSWIAKRGEAKLFRKRASARRWQKETNYGRRALVETAMGRYKAIILINDCALNRGVE